MDVDVEFVGVIARPAGLHGLCSGLRDLVFDCVLVVNGEFGRVDEELEEFDGLLRLFDANGNREEDFAASTGLPVLAAGIGWNAEGFTPFIVLTLLSAKSLWLRLCPGDERGLLGSTSSRAGVTPRYQAVGEDGETSISDRLR